MIYDGLYQDTRVVLYIYLNFIIISVIECELLTDPVHGRILPCGRTEHSECQAQCDDGYILSAGSRWRTCTAQGWTGSPAVCTGWNILIY